MIWFFEREDESLRIETRYDNQTLEFVAIVHYPDGQRMTKRFIAPDVYRRWLEQFERTLEEGDWSRDHRSPVVLSEGWPNKPPI